MNELIDGAGMLADIALEMATKKWGEKFHSEHEAYSVMDEEYEESAEEANKITILMREYWKLIKKREVSQPVNYDNWDFYFEEPLTEGDTRGEQVLYKAKEIALRAIAEMSQLAAMFEKALRGFEK